MLTDTHARMHTHRQLQFILFLPACEMDLKKTVTEKEVRPACSGVGRFVKITTGMRKG